MLLILGDISPVGDVLYRARVMALRYSYGLYKYGPYSYGLYSYGLYSHGLYSYGLCINGPVYLWHT